MANRDGRGLEDRLRRAAREAEDDLRRLIAYFNDEVVPDVRRNGSDALRAAATELHRLAARLDEASGRPIRNVSASPPPAQPPVKPES